MDSFYFGIFMLFVNINNKTKCATYVHNESIGQITVKIKCNIYFCEQNNVINNRKYICGINGLLRWEVAVSIAKKYKKV